MEGIGSAILGGAIAGILIAFLVGPVFFALLQTSIEKGFIMGLTFALGIIISDASFFLLAYFGLSQFNESEHVHTIMAMGGGGFLIFFGLQLALRRPQMKNGDHSEIKRNSVIKSLAKGFLINSLNPGVLLYWVGVVSAAKGNFGGDSKKIFAFFLTTMCIVFLTDILKSYLAFRLKSLITLKFMTWLNRISGSILMLAGGKLLLDALIPMLHGLG